MTTNRAHRERRRRVTRKTWGPAKQRALRRHARITERHMQRVRDLAAFAELTNLIEAATSALAQAFVVASQSTEAMVVALHIPNFDRMMAAVAQGDAVADLQIGVLALDVGPTIDGEFWPDAHVVSFDEEKPKSRDQLDDWLDRSGTVLAEATGDVRVQLHTGSLDIGIIHDSTLTSGSGYTAGGLDWDAAEDTDGVWPGERVTFARIVADPVENPVESLPDHRAETGRPVQNPQTIDGE